MECVDVEEREGAVDRDQATERGRVSLPESFDTGAEFIDLMQYEH